MAGRILVLDDEENYAEMLQDLLRDHNYRVDMATRPERAIDQLEEIPYDLVISDYKMPVMDGADFLKKSRELYPNLPFILVSGLMNTPELVKVANMSVTLVMEKPLDTEAFLSQVARFSEPMTEEEKKMLEEEIQSDGDSKGDAPLSYPAEPRFFSAVSTIAKRFMQNVWTVASEANEVYVLEPTGGDLELVVKDISQWRGNGDMPVASFALPESNDEAIVKLRGILDEFDQSNTVLVELTSISQIGQAKKLTETAIREVGGSDSLLLVYKLSGVEPPEFRTAVGDAGFILPPVVMRPSDVASYARRFARIAAERAGKKNCSEFTAEAAYLLLSCDWSGGYKQIQEVVSAAVKASEADEPLPAELISKALELDEERAVAPDHRFAALMKHAQTVYLENELKSEGVTAAELAKKLELDESVQTHEDLQTMPLVNSNFAKL